MDVFLAGLDQDKRNKWEQLNLASDDPEVKSVQSNPVLPRVCVATATELIQEIAKYNSETPRLDLDFFDVPMPNFETEEIEFIPDYQACISIYLYWENLCLTLTFQRREFSLELFDDDTESEDHRPIHFTYDEVEMCKQRLKSWLSQLLGIPSEPEKESDDRKETPSPKRMVKPVRLYPATKVHGRRVTKARRGKRRPTKQP